MKTYSGRHRFEKMQHWLTPVRFALVGLSTGAIFTILFSSFIMIGLPTGVGNGIAYSLAIGFQFIAHRKFTFRTPNTTKSMVLRFTLTCSIVLLLSTALAILMRDKLGFSAIATGISVSMATAGVNWLVMRRWVFRK